MFLSFTHPKSKCQKMTHINEAHRSSIVLIDKQADECYYSMLANANLDCICLMQKGAIKRLYAAKGGVFFYCCINVN